MIVVMKKFLTVIFLTIFTASNAYSASFMLSCSIETPTDGSYKSLYFFQRIKRFTGYFIEHEVGENKYNFYGKSIDMNYLDYSCRETRLSNIDDYNYSCKGDYRQNKYFESSHTVMIKRDVLLLGRSRIMEGAFGRDMEVIDLWQCNKVENDEANKQLKLLREKIKERDSEIKNAKKNRSKKNKI